MKLILRIIFKIFLITSILTGCATTEEITETDPVVLVNQGTTFGKEGQSDRAIGYFNKAIKINPRYAEAYNNRGIAYFDKGQYDRAISDYNKAIEINPRDAEPYNNRGLAYAQGKGQFDKAISDYTKAIEINPRDAEVYFNRGLVYGRNKGQYARAISDFNKAIEINPNYAEVYNNRGIAYFYQREYEKAWDDVHRAQNLGYKVHPGFLKALRQASGKEK